MRRTAYMFGVTVLLLTAIGICGCSSSSDPIDPLGWRWIASENAMFDGSEERFVIDPTTTDEAYYSITYTSNDDEDYDIFLHTITVTFQGDGNGPDLDPWTIPIGDRLLSANGGSLQEDIYFFSSALKAWYLNEIGGDATGFAAHYRINVTATFSFSQGTGDDDVTITEGNGFTVAPVATPTPTPTPAP